MSLRGLSEELVSRAKRQRVADGLLSKPELRTLKESRARSDLPVFFDKLIVHFERKPVEKMESLTATLSKQNASLSIKEVEKRIKMLSEIVPEWCRLEKGRSGETIFKIVKPARGSDVNELRLKIVAATSSCSSTSSPREAD